LQLGFADWELLRQGVVLERELQAIADFLDEHEGDGRGHWQRFAARSEEP